MKKIALLAGSLTLAVALAGASVATASADYDDGTTVHYGWSIVANETDKSLWEFGDDGNISYCYAAETGDAESQRVNMYALRDIEYAADEGYTVEAMFTPDAETDLSAERTYGVVCWYVDANNYLIYWLQQKTKGDWSGQFYGRVDGSFKAWVGSTLNTTSWYSGEYEDLWWDVSTVTNSTLLGQSGILTSAQVKLKVVSQIETVTVGEVGYTCRSFELHQIVCTDGVEGTDFVSQKIWCRDVTEESDAARVGLYSVSFSYGVSFASSGDNDSDRIAAVESEIEALGTVSSAADIAAVETARIDYERLLDMQSELASGTEEKLETAESAAAAYVDARIEALDTSSSTFQADVAEVYNLYIGLSDVIAAKVTKTSLLAEMVNAANNTPSVTDPDTNTGDTGTEDDNTGDTNTDDDSEEEESSGGCGGIALAGGGIAAALLIIGSALAVIVVKKKKSKR